jgi:biopolymer transport protein ExbB
MIPILACSIGVIAIVFERYWTLNKKNIAPPGLLQEAWENYRADNLTTDRLIRMRSSSPLGEIFAAGLANAKHGRAVMKDAMEDAGNKVAHDMERFLAALGTIATISPLLGLLGTVLGMIDVFTEIMISGTGNAGVLAGGISKALITTASGLTVAIPAMIFYRHFERLIDGMVVEMEQQSTRLVDAVFSEKQVEDSGDSPA